MQDASAVVGNLYKESMILCTFVHSYTTPAINVKESFNVALIVEGKS